MAVRPIRRYGDPIIRKRAGPVSEMTHGIQTLIDDMIETMYDTLGLGLAAPQIGVSLRVIVIDEGTKDSAGPQAFINPVIVAGAGSVRAAEVRVEALDRLEAPVKLEARGLLARIFQHEIDHLDGILFIDRLDKVQRDRIKRKIRREGLPDSVPASSLRL